MCLINIESFRHNRCLLLLLYFRLLDHKSMPGRAGRDPVIVPGLIFTIREIVWTVEWMKLNQRSGVICEMFIWRDVLITSPPPPPPSSPLPKKENMKNQKWICNHPFLVDYNSSHKIGNKSAVCKTYIFHFCRAWRGLKNPRDMMLQLFCKMKKTEISTFATKNDW